MTKKSNIKAKFSLYFPTVEILLILLSISLSTLTTAANFIFGKNSTTIKISIPVLLALYLISHGLMLRGIYYRLRSTSLSSKIYDDLELLSDVKQKRKISSRHIEAYSSKIKTDADDISKELKKVPGFFYSEENVKAENYQTYIENIDSSIKGSEENTKKKLKKFKARMEILQGLEKLKNADNNTQAQSSSGGIVIFLNKHVTGTVILCSILLCTSAALTVSAQTLRSHQMIKNPIYFAMVFTAYGLLTITTTIFTINRVVDRRVKRANHKKIFSLDAQQDSQEKQSATSITHLNNLQKLEIAFNFTIDTITRGASIIISFLYSSSRVNFVVYISVTAALELFGFLMILYSVYDRLSSLQLAEKDQEKLNARKSESNTNEKTSLTLMFCILFVMYPLSVVGKHTVQILYKNNKLSTPVYFVLTFVTILFGACVSFVFNINRHIDTEVTDVNHTLVINAVLQAVQLNDGKEHAV